MPDSLEYFVRPFQTRNAQGVIIIPATPVGTRERATLTWGAAATMPERKMTDTTFNVQCCNEEQDELERTSETVQIPVHADDSGSGYAEIARPTQMRLKKKANDRNSHCIPDVTYFAGPTFGDGFEPHDDAAHGCKITLNLKN